MLVSEAQNLGALTVLITSLAVYGASFLSDCRPLPESFLPWGNQGPDMMAVEVTGSRGGDGIYFLPESMPIATILDVTGIEIKIEPTSAAVSDGTAITISADGGVLKISDMPAVRRLALGLPIDLNRASAEELSRVPGIGDRLASQIAQLRQRQGQFKSLSDLKTVPGIKEKKMISLKKYLFVGSFP
jgi:competence ComEA-like helix-hairpin-helix protein